MRWEDIYPTQCNPIYEFQIKQASGKWAPQCLRSEFKETWDSLKRLGRKLRCLKLINDRYTIIARYNPPEQT